MIEIKDLLSKWSDLLFSEETNKRVLIEVLSEVLGIEIKSEDVKIKNSTVYLSIKPIYRNEILIKQEKIFNKLKDRLGRSAPQEIR